MAFPAAFEMVTKYSIMSPLVIGNAVTGVDDFVNVNTDSVTVCIGVVLINASVAAVSPLV